MSAFTDRFTVGALRGASPFRGLASDALVVLGALFLVWGIREIYEPAALIFVGLVGVAAGVLIARPS